jgi:cysteine synthase
MLELTLEDRERIFNLGYFTWVEQQGTSIEDFEVRRSQGFWRGLRDAIPEWDEAIREVNARTGVLEAM